MPQHASRPSDSLPVNWDGVFRNHAPVLFGLHVGGAVDVADDRGIGVE
jgi:hypothetical protein